ncbi:MAG: aminotransferase class I/II-fold pyridoxal phosphate-dependent enzyme [Bifidobacteriaceae bacterium]|nr:aminotransferase class I/II-fold pyridoxal phosphate-dependent enzyme [Bifidobacteriaceae bacterium]
MKLDVDLRSDTVTRPSDAMRQAMAQADVGDDVLDHDPTMGALEERVAEITGRQAAIWMPSGCMSNLTALMAYLRPGDSLLAPKAAHVIGHELGTVAWLAGGMPRELAWSVKPGVPSPEELAGILGGAEPAYYDLQPRVLVLENTHNEAGGTIIPPAIYSELVAVAHGAGLTVHLDGARLWHAAAAQGRTPAEVVGEADTVSVCLSKGLGAPMGSILAGPADLIKQARRIRKMLGGGVRQGGVVAAAGLVALDQELPRIDQDRVRAVRLASGLRDLGFDAPAPETNILMVNAPDPVDLAERWNQAGVGCFAMGVGVRLVTHRDIDDAAIDLALERMGGAAAA